LALVAFDFGAGVPQLSTIDNVACRLSRAAASQCRSNRGQDPNTEPRPLQELSSGVQQGRHRLRRRLRTRTGGGGHRYGASWSRYGASVGVAFVVSTTLVTGHGTRITYRTDRVNRRVSSKLEHVFARSYLITMPFDGFRRNSAIFYFKSRDIRRARFPSNVPFTYCRFAVRIGRNDKGTYPKGECNANLASPARNGRHRVEPTRTKDRDRPRGHQGLHARCGHAHRLVTRSLGRGALHHQHAQEYSSKMARMAGVMAQKVSSSCSSACTHLGAQECWV
jgi:hypothetical protein